MKQSPCIPPVILADIVLTLVKGKSESYFKKLLDKDIYSNKVQTLNMNFIKTGI